MGPIFKSALVESVITPGGANAEDDRIQATVSDLQYPGNANAKSLFWPIGIVARHGDTTQIWSVCFWRTLPFQFAQVIQ